MAVAPPLQACTWLFQNKPMHPVQAVVGTEVPVQPGMRVDKGLDTSRKGFLEEVVLLPLS